MASISTSMAWLSDCVHPHSMRPEFASCTIRCLFSEATLFTLVLIALDGYTFKTVVLVSKERKWNISPLKFIISPPCIQFPLSYGFYSSKFHLVATIRIAYNYVHLFYPILPFSHFNRHFIIRPPHPFSFNAIISGVLLLILFTLSNCYTFYFLWFSWCHSNFLQSTPFLLSNHIISLDLIHFYSLSFILSFAPLWLFFIFVDHISFM